MLDSNVKCEDLTPHFLWWITAIIQLITNIPRKIEKKILEIFLGRKVDKSKRKTRSIEAQHTRKIVFSILFISENLNILRLITILVKVFSSSPT